MVTIGRESKLWAGCWVDGAQFASVASGQHPTVRFRTETGSATTRTRMNPLLHEVRHNPMLWLLVFVPGVFAAARLKPEAHTLLFVLSVLAIVPLAALLSHATESVAAKTGDAAGGLLNATLGNLTELVIALTALAAGQYTLVKASIAGAIVTNTLSAGRVLPARRAQAPRPGVQPGQRAHAGRAAVPGHGGTADSVDDGRGRNGSPIVFVADAEPGPGAVADRGLCAWACCSR